MHWPFLYYRIYICVSDIWIKNEWWPEIYEKSRDQNILITLNNILYFIKIYLLTSMYDIMPEYAL